MLRWTSRSLILTVATLLVAGGCATTGDAPEAGVETRGVPPAPTKTAAVNPTLRASLSPRVSSYVAAPTSSKKESLFRFLQAHVSAGTSDVMSTLFWVFRNSIEEANEDKRYFLEKLKSMNDIAEAQSEYLKSLMELSGSLGDKDGSGCQGSDDEGVVRVLSRIDALETVIVKRKKTRISFTARRDLDRLIWMLKRERAVIVDLANMSRDLARYGAR